MTDIADLIKRLRQPSYHADLIDAAREAAAALERAYAEPTMEEIAYIRACAKTESVRNGMNFPSDLSTAEWLAALRSFLDRRRGETK